MPKRKVYSVIEAKVAEKIEKHYNQLVAKALKEKKKIPKISNVYEDLIYKGWEVVRKEKMTN